MNECDSAAESSRSTTPCPAILDSNLGSARAESLRLEMIEAIASHPSEAAASVVRIASGPVEELSMASLQVLLAAAGQLHRQGRRLVLTGPSPRLCEWVRLAGVAWLIEGGGSLDGLRDGRGARD
jgi:anti-anti-sigma regulatory factor